jgi:hypothetical protein
MQSSRLSGMLIALRSPACGIGLKRVEDPAVLGNVVGSRAPPI